MNFYYTDYVITQKGQDLITDSAIKIQKYENKVSRLIFKVEDWLNENARLYAAILNPETKRYHYEPLLQTNDGNDWYLVIGTSISYYVGKTKLLLIGVEPSFVLDDNITLDTTATIYVSKEFPRIVVLENFLDDISVEVSLPNLDIALDNLLVTYENSVVIGLQTAQDLVDCNEALEQCQTDMEQCDADLQRCEEILATVSESETNCIVHDESCAAHEENCHAANERAAAILEQNEAILAECNNILTQARNILSTCNSIQNTCNNASNSVNSALQQCQSILTQCQSQLTQITSIRNTVNTQYNDYMSSMYEAYINYMAQIQNGGNP